MKSYSLTLYVPLVTKTEFLLKEMRIEKNINEGINGWSNSKFYKLTSNKLYGRQ